MKGHICADCMPAIHLKNCFKVALCIHRSERMSREMFCKSLVLAFKIGFFSVNLRHMVISQSEIFYRFHFMENKPVNFVVNLIVKNMIKR